MSSGESQTPTTSVPRLTVAQLIGSFDGGGAQRTALNLAEALHRRGCRSLAIAVRSLGGYLQERQTEVEAFSLGGGGLVATLAAVWKLRGLVRSERIDVLHVHGSSSLLLAAFSLLGCGKTRLFFTWHDSESVLGSGGLKRWASRRSLDRCVGVFGSSAIVANKLETAWASGRSVGVFYNGVPEVPERHGAADPPVLLWMARFVPEKDPEILVRAAAALHAEGLAFRVILAGAPYSRHQWFFERVSALIVELGVSDVVELAGWITDTRTLVASADIGVQTSRTEGLSVALLEQMMAGLTVVATDVGETRHALDHGRCGLLIQPGDLGGLIDALRIAITSSQERQRLGSAARMRALSEFSLEAMAHQAMRAYGEPSAS